MKNFSKRTKKLLAIFLALTLLISGTQVFNVFADRADENSSLEEISANLGESSSAKATTLGASAQLFAAGDIVATVTSPQQKFDSYTNLLTNTPPPNLAVNVFAQLKKANILSGKIVLDLKDQKGYLGTPYFKYLNHNTLESNSIFSSVTDNGDGTYTINLKDNQALNSSETITLFFSLKPEYDAAVAPGGLMASPQAEAFVGAEKVFSAPKIEIKSSTTYDRDFPYFPGIPDKAEEDGIFNVYDLQIISSSVRITNNKYYTNKLDFTYNNTGKMYLPVGTEIRSNTESAKWVLNKGVGNLGVPVADGEVEGIPAGNYFVYEYTDLDSFNTNVNAWAILTFIFPTGSEGQIFPIYRVLDHKLLGDSNPKILSYKTEYRINNDPKWNFIFNRNFTTGGWQEAYSGILDGDKGVAGLTTGHSYRNGGSGNFGNVPVTNVEWVLYQGTGPEVSGKVNFDDIYIGFDRESMERELPIADVYFEIIDAKTGTKRDTKNDKIRVTSTSFLDYKDIVDLSESEYIDKIHVIPMGTATKIEEGVMPIFTSLRIYHTFKAWPGQKWPDGTQVGNYTVTPVTYTIIYDDKDGNSVTGLPLTYNSRYQAAGPMAIVQTLPISPNAQTMEPNSVTTYRADLYNNTYFGALGSWVDPVIILGMPAGVHLNSYSGIVAKDPSGTVIGPVDVQVVSETNDRSYYKLLLPDGYELPKSDKLGLTIDFDIKTPAGIAAGDYKLDVVVTSRAGSTFYNGNPAYQNNALPGGQSKADYGLLVSDNYTYSNFAGYAQDKTQKSFKVLPKTKTSASSEIQSDKIAPAWTENKVAAADFGDNVKMKLHVNNNGNKSLTKIKLYDIIPYNGYVTTDGFTSTGNVVFTGITGAPAGSNVYYYHGATPPALGAIGSITVPSAGWDTTPTGATAFFVDFGANQIAPGGNLEIVTNFKVPDAPAPQQTVYNQFSFKYTSPDGDAVSTGESQGFSTHYYGISYAAKSEDTGKVTNLPDNFADTFGVAVAIDATISSQKPTKLYYNFVEWQDKLTGTKYQPGDTVSFTITPSFKELQLEAIFAKDPAYAVTVNYHTNGSTSGAITPASVVSHAGEIISAPNYSTLKLPGKMPNATNPFNTKPIAAQGSPWDFSDPLPAQSVIDLYIDWVNDPAQNFKLAFDVNGGEIASKPADKDVISAQPVGLLPGGDDGTGLGAPTRNNYKFMGWAKTQATANLGVVDFTSASTVSGNTTVYAVWKQTVHIVTLKENTGVAGSVTSLNLKQGNPDNLKLPVKEDAGKAPTKVGHTLLGWAKTSGATTPDFTNGMLATLTADTDLYAVWEKDSFVVTLDGNGATTAGNVTSLTVKYMDANGKSLPINAPAAPVKTGYSFEGWATTSGATTADFVDADLATITAPKTIYAVWKANQYTLTFDKNTTDAGSANGTKTSMSVTYGKAVGTLPSAAPEIPTRTGYVFKGWSEQSGASNTANFNSTYVYNTTGAKTVYAVWELKGIVVTLNANTGVNGSTTILNLKFGNPEAVTLPMTAAQGAPTKVGHDFLGWATTSGAITANFNNINLSVISSDTEVYAVWKLKEYAITFDGNTATTAGTTTSITIKHGNPESKTLPSTIPASPAKTGYNFMGWSLTNGANPTIFTNADLATVTENKTLYAVWEIKAIVVNLKENTGTAGTTTSLNFTYGNKEGKILPVDKGTDAPTKVGHTLLGWAKTSGATTPDFTNGMLATLTADTDLYAVWEKDSFVVTLDGNGATTAGNVTSLTVKYMDANGKSLPINAPAAPVKTGYSFEGWANTSGATTADFVDADLATITAPKTIYAVWKANQYTLTFDKNTTDAGSANGTKTSMSVTYGKAVGTLPSAAPEIPTRTGYVFKGWSEQSGASNTENFNSTYVYNITGAKTVYAVWELKGITVSLNPNSGVAGTKPTLNIIYGNTAGTILPMTVAQGAPTKDGYNLIGWAKTSGALTPDFADGDLATISVDTEVYAVWKLKEYTITFDGNTETTAGTTTSITIKHGNPESKTLPSTTPAAPAKTGYNFMGWSLTNGSNPTIFTNADLAAVTENKTLYAVWEIKAIAVTLKENTGTAGTTTSLNFTYGNKEGKILPVDKGTDAPTKVGYTLSGWAKTSGATTPDFTNSDLATLTSDTDVYAVWKINEYTITLDGNQSTTLPVTEINFTYGNTEGKTLPAVSTAMAPTRTGYEFIGWATTKTATTENFTNADLSTVTESKTVYAVWKANTYTLTFDRNNLDTADFTEASPISKTVTYDSAIGAVPTGATAPTRKGYTFQGWSFTQSATTPSALVGYVYNFAANKTAYAVWDVNKYAVTFDANGGQLPVGFPVNGVVQTNFNTALGANMPAGVPTKEGYNFKGWATTNNAAAPDFTATTVITESISVYAVWEIKTYSVTFNSADATTPSTPAVVQTTHGSSLTGKMPSNPDKVGHTFIGWATTQGATITNFNDTTIIVSDITVYPVFEIKTYDVTINHMTYEYGSSTAVLHHTETAKVNYGSTYKATPMDDPNYNFDIASSDNVTTAPVTGDLTMTLSYKRVVYNVNSKDELELDVNDRNPYKNNSITLEEFINRAEIKITNDKVAAKMAKASNIGKNVTITSPDFTNLDYSTITSGYSQAVTLDFVWDSGQFESQTIFVKISDKIAPVINANDNQEYVFTTEDKVPETEKELIEILKAKGLSVTDNYDSNLEPLISYLDGGFNSIKWSKGNIGSWIIFVNAVDTSGNKALEKKAIILAVEITEGNSEDDKNSGSNKVDVDKDKMIDNSTGRRIPETGGGNSILIGANSGGLINLDGSMAGQLPKTGATIASISMLAGLPILALIFLRKKKEKNDDNEI